MVLILMLMVLLLMLMLMLLLLHHLQRCAPPATEQPALLGSCAVQGLVQSVVVVGHVDARRRRLAHALRRLIVAVGHGGGVGEGREEEVKLPGRSRQAVSVWRRRR